LGGAVSRRTFYAWFDPKKGEFRLSLFPADAPVRPSIAFREKADVLEYAQKKRGQLMWWPPLGMEHAEKSEPYSPNQRSL
jgi:hypothetical protein